MQFYQVEDSQIFETSDRTSFDCSDILFACQLHHIPESNTEIRNLFMGIYKRLKRSAELARLGIDLKKSREDPNSTLHVANRMAAMRGLPQKFGQMLSLSSDNAAAFSSLCETPSVLSKSEVEAILNHYYTDWRGTFNTFEFDGVGASLGQVHRAELRTNSAKTPVAVKIQYPFVRDGLEADLSALGMLSAPLARRKGFSVSSYKKAFRESLLKELDYSEEAQALSRFHSRLLDDPLIISPEPFPELCTPEIIVMDWIEGVSLSHASELDFTARFQLARALLQFFLKGWLLWGEIHTDPHSGNYRIIQKDQGTTLGVLDFGCTYKVPVEEGALLRKLLTDGSSLENKDLIELYVALGWDIDLLSPLQDHLSDLTSVLLEPFKSGGPFNTRNWNLSERIEQILGELRWNFRFAGPASLMLFLRGFTGLLSNLNMLGVPLNWGLELSRVLGDLQRTPVVHQTTVPTIRAVEKQLSSATNLYLEVKRDGEVKARICLPASAIERLEDFIPDDVAAKLLEQSINTGEIARVALSENLPPGQLFSLEDEERAVRVWLS